jgi:hypothetical protein
MSKIEMMAISFMDIRISIPFGKLTRFFPHFLVVRLHLGDEFLSLFIVVQ